jgi:hypothetical protein
MSVQIGTAVRPARPGVSVYSWLSVLFVLIAFSRTYLVPLATNQFTGLQSFMCTAVLFLAWTILFALQTQFVGRGRIDWHRTSGVVGVSLATAMVFTGVTLIVRGLSYGISIGNEISARTISIIPFSSIAMFSVYFTAALLNLRRPRPISD